MYFKNGDIPASYVSLPEGTTWGLTSLPISDAWKTTTQVGEWTEWTCGTVQKMEVGDMNPPNFTIKIMGKSLKLGGGFKYFLFSP